MSVIFICVISFKLDNVLFPLRGNPACNAMRSRRRVLGSVYARVNRQDRWVVCSTLSFSPHHSHTCSQRLTSNAARLAEDFLFIYCILLFWTFGKFCYFFFSMQKRQSRYKYFVPFHFVSKRNKKLRRLLWIQANEVLFYRFLFIHKTCHSITLIVEFELILKKMKQLNFVDDSQLPY